MKNRRLAIGLLVLVILLGVGGIVYAVYNKPEERIETKDKDKEPQKEPEKEPSVYTDTDFNLKFVKTVNSTQSGNYLVSPYSVEIALQMLKEGANGETAEQIGKVIGNRKINNVAIPNRIGVANALFIKDVYKDYITTGYVDKLKENYDAEVLYDKFATPDVINNWAKEKTNGMIDNVLDDISKDFVLGIADALAIDVDWASQFECNRTNSQNFTKENGLTMKTEMMHNSFEYNASYFETENAKGVILPYATYDENGEEIYTKDGNQLEFIAILPNDKASKYVDNLTIDELKAIDANKQSAGSNLEIDLALPRFAYSFDLKEFGSVLRAMGINDVFNPEKADLTNLMTVDNMAKIGTDRLYVSKSVHKTYIDLNEKGTKAAAVTFFGIEKNAAVSPHEKKVVKIEFNKSFVYMIRDVKTKELLFFGVVNEPNVWKGTTCSNK